MRPRASSWLAVVLLGGVTGTAAADTIEIRGTSGDQSLILRYTYDAGYTSSASNPDLDPNDPRLGRYTYTQLDLTVQTPASQSGAGGLGSTTRYTYDYLGMDASTGSDLGVQLTVRPDDGNVFTYTYQDATQRIEIGNQDPPDPNSDPPDPNQDTVRFFYDTGSAANKIDLQLEFDPATFGNDGLPTSHSDFYGTSFFDVFVELDEQHSAYNLNISGASVQSVAFVPEPATLGLLATSALGLALRRRRRSQG